jgi:hypothetical protein
MNWNAIGAGAELLGAIGGIASLVYLATQIRNGRDRARVARWVVVLLAAGLLACEPSDRRPGTWLSGDIVSEAVSDWSFTADAMEVYLETRTWYGVPHPSVYAEGDEFPDARFWNRNVVRDPRVRVKVGSRVYARTAVVVTDPAERDVALRAFAAKYPFWQQLLATPEAERPPLHYFRMEPPEPASG